MAAFTACTDVVRPISNCVTTLGNTTIPRKGTIGNVIGLVSIEPPVLYDKKKPIPPMK